MYKQLYVPSHVSKFTVPPTFGIPSGKTAVAEGWPEELWGLRLGDCVHRIRNKGLYASFRASYETIGLIMCSINEHKGIVLATALETFKKEVVLKDNSAKYLVTSAEDQAKSKVVGSGNDDALPPTIKFRVPYAFVVPMDSPDWPPETWGMNLGMAVSSMRCGFAVYSAMHMERFASIGLDVSPPKPKTTSQRVVHVKWPNQWRFGSNMVEQVLAEKLLLHFNLVHSFVAVCIG
jgi:hypothetical protein